ncbi:RES domain-containing protein [Salinarimonas sp.]|uniref:RES family NAD+ phosphorylase n=1 Tax=Salinarimonas sp. TaxID=2766526 RepID=UPI0032D94EC8
MRLRGLLSRAHDPGWAFVPTSGEGARRQGGRFNRRGVPALYLARALETAWLEAQQGFAFKPQPKTICAYEIDCEDIVDLTDPAERLAHGVSPADLSCAWEDVASRGGIPPSWVVADRLQRAGAAGAIVPSFAPGVADDESNVVLWRWGPDLPHRIKVVDDRGRLPRDDSSWR